MSPIVESSIERGLRLAALSAALSLLVMTVFVFREGLPLLVKVQPHHFLFGQIWRPLHAQFGILPMLIGSVMVTLLALLLGVPVALSCAIVQAELAPPRVRWVLKPLIELLASVPSVVYGFLGLVTVVPWIRQHLGGPGTSALAAAIVLSVMILPTICAVATDALLAVPQTYREGALALGATGWQTIHRVVLPAARPGLLTAIILGTGRAIGETMAVIIVAGNAVALPRSVLDPVRTLTAHIALEMSYATGDHARSLFATGVVLFVMVMALIVVSTRLAETQRTERQPGGARQWWRSILHRRQRHRPAELP